MFPVFGKKREFIRSADSLYLAAVQQARNPVFYAEWGVPDTVDGRFELITLHVFLILQRLKTNRRRADRLGQCLFDTMFADMDRALREMGAGDLGVGKRVKAMATAFYGRVAAYEKALTDPDESLDDAIFRNIYRSEEGHEALAKNLALYVSARYEEIGKIPVEDIRAGSVSFGPVEV